MESSISEILEADVVSAAAAYLRGIGHKVLLARPSQIRVAYDFKGLRKGPDLVSFCSGQLFVVEAKIRSSALSLVDSNGISDLEALQHLATTEEAQLQLKARLARSSVARPRTDELAGAEVECGLLASTEFSPELVMAAQGLFCWQIDSSHLGGLQVVAGQPIPGSPSENQ